MMLMLTMHSFKRKIRDPDVCKRGSFYTHASTQVHTFSTHDSANIREKGKPVRKRDESPDEDEGQTGCHISLSSAMKCARLS